MSTSPSTEEEPPLSDTASELPAVQRRFEESATALEELRSRLRGLADAQSQQEASARSIDEGAAVLTKVAGELSDVLGAVHTGVATLDGALNAARTMIESADIQGLTARFDAAEDGVRKAVSEELSRVAATVNAAVLAELSPLTGANEKLDGLGANLVALRSDVAELASSMVTIEATRAERDQWRANAEQWRTAFNALNAKVAALDDRTKKKHGLA